MSYYRVVISLYTIIPKSMVISFNIFISVIVVAGSGNIVAKFAAISIKIPIINTFFIYDIRPIVKNFDFSVIK
jgi:hypothetical protein